MNQRKPLHQDLSKSSGNAAKKDLDVDESINCKYDEFTNRGSSMYSKE